MPNASLIPNAGIPFGAEVDSPRGAADRKGSGAGVVFMTPAGDALFVKRKGADHAGRWAFPGGRVEDGEAFTAAARREAEEETQAPIEKWSLRRLSRFLNEGMDFTTFRQDVEDRFDPTLNDEHDEYMWAPFDDPPEPLHPGVAATLAEFFKEEATEPDHKRTGAARKLEGEFKSAEDAEFNEEDHPRRNDGKFGEGGSGKKDPLTKFKERKLRQEEKDGREFSEFEARLREPVKGYKDADPSKVNRVNRPVETLAEKLVSLLGPEYKVSHSNSGFGKSSYVSLKNAIYGESRRVRISDHHANPRPSELHIDATSVSEPDLDKAIKFLKGNDSGDESSRHIRGTSDHRAKDQYSANGENQYMSGIPPKGELQGVNGDSVLAFDHLAFDRGSVRSFDHDGRMRVDVANISKAQIRPYKGNEIPNWEELKLEPEKIYHMLCPPDELEKAADTFNGVQVLHRHTPVDADDPKKWDIVGTTGSDAHFEDPYLKNSLYIWDQKGIDLIESEKQRELSCGYHYDPEMTPGKFSDMRYDGVMRNIRGNHIALVEEGRAGHDVMVGDSSPSWHRNGRSRSKELNMTTKPTRLEFLAVTRTARAINPTLAMDAQVDYSPIFKGLTSKNFKARKPTIVSDMKRALTGKVRKTLGMDAPMEHLAHLLNEIEHVNEPKSLDASVSEEQHKAMEAAAHGKSNLDIPKKVGEEFVRKDKGEDKSMDRKTFDAFMKAKGASEDSIKRVHDMIRDELPENALDEWDDEDEDKEDDEDGGKDRRAKDAKAAKDARRAKDADLDEEMEDAKDERSDEDEDEEDKPRAEAKDRNARDARRSGRDSRVGKDRKGAMDSKNYITVSDAALIAKSAVTAERKRTNGIQEARSFCRPYVGELPMALDSAEAVYKAAARARGIEDADDINEPVALRALIKIHGPAGARAPHDVRMTQDEQIGAVESTLSRFPGMGRIQNA